MEGFGEHVCLRQAELPCIRGRRIRAAVRDCYRAFTQRSRWLREDLLLVGELDGYERKLREESEIQFERQVDRLGEEAGEDPKTAVAQVSAMGSTANAIACHLMAHLALHRWFVGKSRPVPRFLFLDRPSQAYLPAEQDVNAAMDDLADEDRLAVARMLELIRDVVADLAPAFQVIVTEHADLSEDWYRQALIERWRKGNKLIPATWYSNNDMDSVAEGS